MDDFVLDTQAPQLTSSAALRAVIFASCDKLGNPDAP